MSNIVLWRSTSEVHQAVILPNYMTARYRLGNTWHKSTADLSHNQAVDEVQFLSGHTVVVGGIIDVCEQPLGQPDAQLIVERLVHAIHGQMTEQQIEALGYSVETYRQAFPSIPAHQRNWIAKIRWIE